MSDPMTDPMRSRCAIEGCENPRALYCTICVEHLPKAEPVEDMDMDAAYTKWHSETLGDHDHFSYCKFQNAPLDVCDCMERHAFHAGFVRRDRVAKRQEKALRADRDRLHQAVVACPLAEVSQERDELKAQVEKMEELIDRLNGGV